MRLLVLWDCHADASTESHMVAGTVGVPHCAVSSTESPSLLLRLRESHAVVGTVSPILVVVLCPILMLGLFRVVAVQAMSNCCFSLILCNVIPHLSVYCFV